MAVLPSPTHDGPQLSPGEFELFRRFIFNEAGIDMNHNKRALVQSRLAPRLRHLGCATYTQYHRILELPESHLEREQAINLLSTNETYFFREPQHFDWLQKLAQDIASNRSEPLRIWSAACSTGEEPYTIAIALAEALGPQAPWYLYATDINTKVTRYARRAVFPFERIQKTPPHLWHKYFLRGHDEYAGKVRLRPELAQRVVFGNLNLLHCSKSHERDFDVIFLRNVLIYFNEDTKSQVIKQLCAKLVDGGYLIVGHAEAIRAEGLPLVQEAPSRYRHSLVRTASRPLPS